MLLSQCFLHSELDNGRPSTTQFKDKLPWFLDALPSSDCSKGGKGAYSTSLDLSGVCSMLLLFFLKTQESCASRVVCYDCVSYCYAVF
jgi:hypothetical protein